MVSGLRNLAAPALPAFHMIRREVAQCGRRIVSLSDRLSTIPRQGLSLSDQVTIFWDEHQVPFIEARKDDDLAIALGLVHAHLRPGQMELLRKASRGRLSEAFGSIALDVGQLLRFSKRPILVFIFR
jgi:acyl-homoserine lactone acylase PvdQ